MSKEEKAATKGEIRSEKQRVLDDTVKELQEKFGEGAIMMLGNAPKVDVDAIPTGSLALDMALGIGGIPKGRVIELFGPESSGKTTLALHIVAQVQKRAGLAAFVDAVAALTPRAEIEGEMGQQHMGLQARLMSHALRKLTGSVSKTKTTVIFINQIRMQIGIVFGNPETTPGGKALKFYASVRIEVRRAAQIKKGEEIIGNRVNAKIVKNKVAPPFRRAEFDIFYNEGISREAELLTLGEKFGIIKKAGASFTYQGMRLGQGFDNARQFLKENSKVAEELARKIREGAPVVAVAAAEVEK